VLRIGELDFRLVCTINPALDENGVVLEYLPQAKYQNAGGIALNTASQLILRRPLLRPSLFALHASGKKWNRR
jgi:hypothetical protein